MTAGEQATAQAAAVAAAREAGALQRLHFEGEFTVACKAANTDLVTEVDRQSEALIVARLRRDFPGDGILAEESGWAPGKGERRWIIDPLDGTTNFAHGFPWFAVSIALEVAGTLQVGVVYHPMLDELFTAARGQGAFLNGRRLAVTTRQRLADTLLATGFPYDRSRENENNFDLFVEFHLLARGIRRAGAASLDLAYVAAGRFDGFWECKLKPWDVAAGSLLVTEAGGRVSGYGGEPHTLDNHRILASNGHVHGAMCAVLAQHRSEGGA